jgi:hypothetical protein
MHYTVAFLIFIMGQVGCVYASNINLADSTIQRTIVFSIAARNIFTSSRDKLSRLKTALTDLDTLKIHGSSWMGLKICKASCSRRRRLKRISGNESSN